MEERIHVAVHSAKDLPSELQAGSTIAAVLTRGPVEDLLISKSPMRLEALPQSATIATGSVRRQRQARWRRSDVKFVDLRGNVPTRLRKFAASDWDAIILARAGLERLSLPASIFEFEGQKFFAKVLSTQHFVPSGGQGVIALQTRAEKTAIVSAVDHAPTHLCLRAERECLRLLQGDCDLPSHHATSLNEWASMVAVREPVQKLTFPSTRNGGIATISSTAKRCPTPRLSQLATSAARPRKIPSD